jgi:hypothetical protein
MDTATGVIPDISLVPVSETMSSPVMELLGFRHSLANIEMVAERFSSLYST